MKTNSFYLSLLLLCAVLLPWRSFGLLQVFPTRLELNDRKRVATVSLRHVGKKPGEYRVSAVFYSMKPDGGIELAPTPDKQAGSISKMLRFSPRQTTIPPNMEQVVRVMYSGPGNLPEGDYRAHLHFEPIGDTEGIGSIKSEGAISMNVEARLAVAIPVIFHRGKTAAKVTLASPQFITMPNKNRGLSVQMSVKGNAYPYGNFFAYFIPDSGEKEEQIGFVRGIASYIPERTVTFPLTPPKGLVLSNGKLRIEYKQPDEDGGKILGQLTTAIP